MKKVLGLLLVLGFSLAFPTLMLAQASKHFRETAPAPCAAGSHIPDGTSGNFRLKLKFVNQQIIDTGAINVPTDVATCATGNTASVISAKKLCEDAQSKGYVCTCVPAGPGCPGPSVCDIAPAAFAVITCDVDPGPAASGFALTHGAPFEHWDVSGLDAADVLQSALDSNAGVGNEIGTDPLPVWLHEVSTIGGILTYKVYNSCGGPTPNPKTFTVDTTSKTPLQVAQEIASNFNAPLLPCASLPATVHINADIPLYSVQASEFNCSHFVRVRNTNDPNVQEISVIGPVGSVTVSEGSTGTGAVVSVPSLNQWGVVALVGLVVVTSYWYLRRRVRPA